MRIQLVIFAVCLVLALAHAQLHMVGKQTVKCCIYSLMNFKPASVHHALQFFFLSIACKMQNTLINLNLDIAENRACHGWSGCGCLVLFFMYLAQKPDYVLYTILSAPAVAVSIFMSCIFIYCTIL